MNPTDILIKAKASISDPQNWYKGGYGDPSGTCLCAYAAVDQIEPAGIFAREGGTAALDLLDMAAKELYPEESLVRFGNFSVIQLNDHPDTTHEMIMRVYEHAIGASLHRHGATTEGEQHDA